MSKKKNKKVAEDKALIAELHSKAQNSSKTEVAQAIAQEVKAEVAQAKTLKVRDVKDFIVQKNQEELDADSRTVIKERRAYMLDALDTEMSEVYNATLYTNAESQKVELLTQKISDKLVQQFVDKLDYSDTFTAQQIMREMQTKGGAYGDKVRNSLYRISLYVTKEQMNSDIENCMLRAKTLKKQCLYFNTIEESRRAKYEFIKIV